MAFIVHPIIQSSTTELTGMDNRVDQTTLEKALLY